MVRDDLTPARRALPWTTVGLASLIAVAVLAAIWSDALPREVVCPAIYPAPESCTTEHRRDTKIAWTAVVATIYVLVVVATLTVGRRDRWIPWAGLVTLALVGMLAYRAVMSSTGFIISP